jgi:hypothetical protein
MHPKHTSNVHPYVLSFGVCLQRVFDIYIYIYIYIYVTNLNIHQIRNGIILNKFLKRI